MWSTLLLAAACAAPTEEPAPGSDGKADSLDDRRVVFEVLDSQWLVGDRSQRSIVEDELDATDDGSTVFVRDEEYVISSYAHPITIGIDNPGLIDIATMGFVLEQRWVHAEIIGDIESGDPDDIEIITTRGEWTPVSVRGSFDCPDGSRSQREISMFRELVIDWKAQRVSFETSLPAAACGDDVIDFVSDDSPIGAPVSLEEFDSVDLRIRAVPLWDFGDINGTFDYRLEIVGHQCSICS